MACPNEGAFGPVVRDCRGDFDFTLQFEEIFFSIVPSCLFLICGFMRIAWLMKRLAVYQATPLLWSKITAIIVFTILQLAELVIAIQKKSTLVDISVPAIALRFGVSLLILLLSAIEHMRSTRPSVLLSCFLLPTLLLDIVRARTLWLIGEDHGVTVHSGIAVATTLLKAIVVILEAQPREPPPGWKASHSPEENSGIFGLSTYTWLNRLFLSGFRSLLSIDDLYALDQTMSASFLQGKLVQRTAKVSGSTPAQKLSQRMFGALTGPLLLPVGPRLAVIGFTFCQPFLIETLLSYLQSPDEPNFGYGLIGAAAIIYTGMAISYALYYYWQERFACMVRGILVNAVYQKTTELPTAVAADSAALTLMNSDIERVKAGFLPIHEYWANTIEVALACWLLERKIGAAFAAPVVVVVLCIVASAGVATLTGRRQMAWMESIEERVAATATTISMMKSLRISGMVDAVKTLIQRLRERELEIGGKWRLMLVFAVTLSFTPLTIGPMMAFAVTSRTLDVTRIFPAMAYMMLLSAPLVSLFQNVPTTISALACLSRIDAYMEKPSRVDQRTIHRSALKGAEKGIEYNEIPAIEVIDGNFGWTPVRNTLSNVNFAITSSALTIIIGQVASGKSTLLKALLGETTFSSGTIVIKASSGRIGYCDQTPCLFNDTIRANILCGAQFEATRYQQVLHAAALLTDLTQLLQGDSTVIGGSGISLSGGQKQRLALARALYLEAEIYLFDDILSGLDVSTSSLVFERALGPRGLLARSGSTVVLCTHDSRYLPAANHVIAISKDGTLAGQGAFPDLVGAGLLKGVEGTSDHKNVFDHMVEADIDPLPEAESREDPTELPQEDESRQLGDFTIYRHYFTSMETWVIIAFVVSCCYYGFASNFPTVWLKYWSDDVMRPNPTQSGAFYIGIYAFLQTTCLISLMIVVLLCTQSMISQTGSALHMKALQTVINAPLRFFAVVDTGTVTNLFAQDLTLIDSELPLSLLNVALTTFALAGMSAVIAIASPWLAIAYPFLAGTVYYVQLFYLRTSRQLRLLDLESKAPLYEHFIDTLGGLVTLRAFGNIGASIATSHKLLDTSQRPTYLLAMIQRWLQFVLRLLVMLLATIIVTLATQLQTNAGFTGATLVALMNFGEVLALLVESYTILETSIGAVARLRTFSLSTPPESQPGEDVIPDDAWPQRGQIDIEGISASYSGETSPGQGNPALSDLNITFHAGERVAVVGRTGSGKSSLILLLLRLLDPLQDGTPPGRLMVDGISLLQVQRNVLRRRFIAVSQDPIFLPSCSEATLRANLDPFQESSDPELLDTLRQHGLEFLAQRQPEQDEPDLDAPFTPDQLSQGQKQLFNLARAVIRRRVRSHAGAQGGILLLDEVSSSVDSHTDEKMWDIIQNEFEGYTVIMIAHRLDLAMKCDRVVVMDGGRVAETGQPDDLRSVNNGMFRSLLEARDKISRRGVPPT